MAREGPRSRLLRAGVLMVLGVAFSTGLTWLVRMSTGHTTFQH